MNKLSTFLLALLGLGTGSACSQSSFTDADVKSFADIINTGVQLVDVRTASEYAENHLEGSLNIDAQQSTFLEQAKGQLDAARPVAVYCRSGRRSAAAAKQLAAEGFQVTNLKGGILAWQEAKQPVTTAATEVDVFTTKGGHSVRFYALMHACVRIVYDGKEIQIDPVRQLGDRTVIMPLCPRPITSLSPTSTAITLTPQLSNC